MRGTILGIHDGRGVLLGEGERRFEFPLTEWRSSGTPFAGQIVDYVEEGGQARAVFAVPGASSAPRFSGAPESSSRVLGIIGIICLVVSFLIPLLPTIAAFVLGVIAAKQAKEESDDTSLLLGRISWIGAVVMLGIGFLAMLAIIAFVGTMGLAGMWHGWNWNF
ncbi:MAG: hypothetical protein ABL871_07410 [Terricaulis sp.]